ncbi:hypothetical protein C0J52_20425 [Blattella germanica]|nr:hypothetical protein C0J52_20425 [Blattella germanica]
MSRTCVACLEILQLPFISCESGHCKCLRCKGKFQYCPVCGGCFNKPFRSLTVKNFIEKDETYNCQNFYSGCVKTLTLDELSAHNATCKHEISYICPYNGRCGRFMYNELRDHIVDHHFSKIALNSIYEVQDIRDEQTWQRVIFAFDEIFFTFAKFQDYFLSYAVLYIGPTDKSDDYKYKFTVYSSTGNEMFSNTQRTKYFKQYQVVFKIMDCVVLDLKKVRPFSSSPHSLKYKCEVIKVQK